MSDPNPNPNPSLTRTDRPARMPGAVIAAVAGLWLLTLVYTGAMVSLFLEAKSKADHGQEGGGMFVAGGIVGMGVVALLAVSAVGAMTGRRWARWGAVALLAFFLFCALVAVLAATLVAQDPFGIAVTGGLALVLACTGGLLLTRSAGRWFVR